MLEDANINLADPTSFSTPDAVAAIEQASAAMDSDAFQTASDNVNA